jgi:hypothetical protein
MFPNAPRRRNTLKTATTVRRSVVRTLCLLEVRGELFFVLNEKFFIKFKIFEHNTNTTDDGTEWVGHDDHRKC